MKAFATGPTGEGELRQVRLINFKGFRDFTVNMKGDTFLVGPNNAGKSTIINGLRLVAAMLQESRRLRPLDVGVDDRSGRQFQTRPVPSNAAGFSDENVHFEFGDEPAVLEAKFSTRAKIVAIWPNGEAPFYYLEHFDGAAQPPTPTVVSKFYPTMGVIQSPAPLEAVEASLSLSHVRSNLGTRLSSRHFRNQLHYFREEDGRQFDEYRTFVLEHTPELSALDLHLYASGVSLEYVESTSRLPKEISWAGDGLQIWLQLLFHLFRLRNCRTIVLDEPDIYLHPDMQRRLVDIIATFDNQVILASHAPEVLSEAPSGSAVIVDRLKRRAVRVDSPSALDQLDRLLVSRAVNSFTV